MLFNNPFFEADYIASSTDSVESLQLAIKALYFKDSDIPNEEVIQQLHSAAFRNFPRLQYALLNIFAGYTNFQIPEELKYWEPYIRQFAYINHQYCYFPLELSPVLYNRLAITTCKISILLERNRFDHEMAYKLMVLFYDPQLTDNENFEQISEKFNGFLDHSKPTPLTNVFLRDFLYLPIFTLVKDYPSWQAFVIREGYPALQLFSKFAQRRPAFSSMQEAQDTLFFQAFPQAQEHLKLAKLCHHMRMSNEVFKENLALVNSGWPKKEIDNLPIVDIADKTGEYFWVRVLPQDLLSLHLKEDNRYTYYPQQYRQDAIHLSDSGFYVLLQAKNVQANALRLIDDEINVHDFNILAHAFAWKSNHGNLVLHRIEWHQKDRMSDIVKELMPLFTEQVFEKHPHIKHINIGNCASIERHIYPDCTILETIKQGCLPQNAKEQFRIASNVSRDDLASLKTRLKNYSSAFKDAVLYLAPYFQDIKSLPEALLKIHPNMVKMLPQQLDCINLPPVCAVNDFQQVSYENYLTMPESEQMQISTVCKIFNSHNDKMLSKWLPTIPAEALHLISLMKRQYSCEFQAEVLKRLPAEHLASALEELDLFNVEILEKCLNNPEILKTILDIYPSSQIVNAIHDKKLKQYSILQQAESNPPLFKMILESLSPEQCLQVLKDTSKDNQSILMRARYDLTFLKMILELLPPTQRLQAILHNPNHPTSILRSATGCQDFLQMILELLSPEEQLIVIRHRIDQNHSIMLKAANYSRYLNIILKQLPPELHLDAVLETNNHQLLLNATKDMESLHLILSIYPIEQRLALLLHKNPNGAFFLSSLFTTDYNIGVLLKTIFALLSPEHRLEAVKSRNQLGQSLLWGSEPDFHRIKMVLELLPAEEHLEALLYNAPDVIFLTIETRKEDFLSNPDDVILSALSIHEFVNNMLHHAPPENIQAFVDALIRNEGMAHAKQVIIDYINAQKPAPQIIDALSFFPGSRLYNPTLCFQMLHPFWLAQMTAELQMQSQLMR